MLREVGLVRVRQDAQRRWYELHPEPLAEVDSRLEPYRKLWGERLDALERHLNGEEGGSLIRMPFRRREGNQAARLIG